MSYNLIQGQDIMRTEFVNNTLDQLCLSSNKITDASDINQYVQNFTGLKWVGLNANPINFQNVKKMVKVTNLSVKEDYRLNLMYMRELSNIQIEKVISKWKLKLYDMYVKDPKKLDRKTFTILIGNIGFSNYICMVNGNVDEYYNGNKQSSLPLAIFMEEMALRIRKNA